MLAQGLWFAGMLAAHIRRARSRQDGWARLGLFLLTYWIALSVQMRVFHVFLEGPMAGIWFWTVFGAGLVRPGCTLAIDWPMPSGRIDTLPRSRRGPAQPALQPGCERAPDGCVEVIKCARMRFLTGSRDRRCWTWMHLA